MSSTHCADCRRELAYVTEEAIGLCTGCESRETRWHRLGVEVVRGPESPSRRTNADVECVICGGSNWRWATPSPRARLLAEAGTLPERVRVCTDCAGVQ